METIAQRYEAQANRAGYAGVLEDVIAVFEDELTFYVLCEGDEVGEYFLGQALKENSTRAMDYMGCPAVEGSMEEVLQWVKENI